jgi:hypothetical protein
MSEEHVRGCFLFPVHAKVSGTRPAGSYFNGGLVGVVHCLLFRLTMLFSCTHYLEASVVQSGGPDQWTGNFGPLSNGERCLI